MMSILPKASIAAWTSLSGASPWVRSPENTAVSPWISFEACSATSPSRSLMRTFAPCELSSSAVARPIPRADPVTIATLSSRTPIRVSFMASEGREHEASGVRGRPMDRAAQLAAIANEIETHVPCGFEPCETCTHFVPGEGSPDARIVIVGEAPGASEDKAGRPFVGRAGKLLDSLLEEAGIVRDDVFITNVVKARPPGNRDPRADEVAHHWPWLERQLDVIRPQLVVPLGRHALRRLAPEAKIGEVHGTGLEAGGRVLFPLYHPAAALHNPRLRETLVDDA